MFVVKDSGVVEDGGNGCGSRASLGQLWVYLEKAILNVNRYVGADLRTTHQFEADREFIHHMDTCMVAYQAL